MQKRLRKEDRACRIVELLEGEASVRSQVSVPRASRHIDQVVDMDEPNPAWGPLRPLLARRQTVMEHYSRTFSIQPAMRSVAKAIHLADEHWAAPSHDRPPLLLFTVVGEPRKAIAAMGLQPQQVPGVFYGRLGNLLEIALVNLRKLPRELSVLRLMALPRTAREARENLEALDADPTVLQSDKDALLEEIMSETMPATKHERRLTVERVREEGRREGRREERLAVTRELAVKLLADGMAAQKVADLTGLDLAEVKRLAQ